jgi:integrase
LEIALTEWHDFRHFFSTQLRRDGTHPKLVSNLLGHANVHLALDVYYRVEVGELQAPVEKVSAQVLCDVMESAVSS